MDARTRQNSTESGDQPSGNAKTLPRPTEGRRIEHSTPAAGPWRYDVENAPYDREFLVAPGPGTCVGLAVRLDDGFISVPCSWKLIPVAWAEIYFTETY